MIYGSYPACHQVLKLKFYWNIDTPICSGIIYDCFLLTTTELNSIVRSCLTCKTYNTYYLALKRKSLQTPALNQEIQNSSHSCISFHSSDPIVLDIFLKKIIHSFFQAYSLELLYFFIPSFILSLLI